MFNHREPQVIVAGAGPVGLFAALSLARRGVNVEIIDEEWRGTARSYALALHPASLELLDQLGLATEVIDRARRVPRLGIYDGESRQFSVDYSKLGAKFPFIAVMPQGELEALLTRALEKSGVEVQWNRRLAMIESHADHAEATVETLAKEAAGNAIAQSETVVESSRTLRPRFLIGADGHASLTRTQLRIRFGTVRTRDRFAIFEFDVEGELPDEVCVVMTGGTTSVLWPMLDGRCRWSFQIPDADSRRDTREKDRLLMATAPSNAELDQAMLLDAIKIRAPWFDENVGKLRWNTFVHFDYRFASEFGKGRVWLAGDAAHMTGPVGAQSMNVGMREAAELTEILASILQGGADLPALDAYGQRRLAEWRTLLGVNGSPFSLGATVSPWLAQRAARLVSCIPASGAHFDRVAEQLGLAPAS